VAREEVYRVPARWKGLSARAEREGRAAGKKSGGVAWRCREGEDATARDQIRDDELLRPCVLEEEEEVVAVIEIACSP
jgi:hypothetical protein